MNVKLWGVRGSLPAPQSPQYLQAKMSRLLDAYARAHDATGVSAAEFLTQQDPRVTFGYGGHTACIQVTTPKANLIVDGGSGIRRLGEQLALGPCGLGRGEIHLLFTHFHWDHLMGLPFFLPLFVPGNRIHVYSVESKAEMIMRTVFCKPFFPVPYEHLGAEFIYHQLDPRQPSVFDDLTVTPYRLDHPDPCWGYRFEHAGKVFSYCVDTEARRVSREDLGEDLPLYQGVDLMVFDAQYSFLEAAEKVNWGHASAPIGLDLAIREGVKKILFVHHDPAASDEKIADFENQTRVYYEELVKIAQEQGQSVHQVEWGFAPEGQQIEV